MSLCVFWCVCFSLDTCKKTDGQMMMMIARRPGPTLGRSRDQSQLSPARWWWQLIQPAPIFFVHFLRDLGSAMMDPKERVSLKLICVKTGDGSSGYNGMDKLSA